jgi:hypothetical protein
MLSHVAMPDFIPFELQDVFEWPQPSPSPSVDTEADTVMGDDQVADPMDLEYSPASPAYSPPPPSYIEDDANLPEVARIDSVVNRELILEAVRLLDLYTRVERGRGRGRPPLRQRLQQQHRLERPTDSLETLR